MPSRRLSLAILAVVATLWAAGLVVLGVWLLVLAPSTVRIASASIQLDSILRAMGALATISAGQLVFLCLVADRLFPAASRRVVWPVELASCAALLLGIGGLVAGLIGTLVWG